MFEYTISFKGKSFNAVHCSSLINLHVEKVFNAGAKKQKTNGHYDFGYLRIAGKNLLDMLEGVYDFYVEQRSQIDFVEVEVTYFYQGQCNLEFSASELSALKKVDANLSITCVEE